MKAGVGGWEGGQIDPLQKELPSKSPVLLGLNNLRLQIKSITSQAKLHVYSLREKCPNTEFFLVRILLHSD